MDSRLDLRLLTPAEWRVLRTARLQALHESPTAFASRYAHESRWKEAEWRRLFDGATWIVGREAAKIVGLARSVSEPGQAKARHVESIWVAPSHRRRGVLRLLLDTVIEIERQAGVDDLFLWVLEDNLDAQRAYETLGFAPTGEQQFLPDLGRFERRMKLKIGSRNQP